MASESDPLPHLDFDLSEGVDASTNAPSSQSNPQQPGAHPSTVGTFFHRLKSRGGVLGSLATVAIAIAKFLGPLKLLFVFLLKFKLLLTLATIAASIWLEAKVFGLPLAVGIVAMIFIHECGHALASRKLGHKYSGMLFVPFAGAVVFSRHRGTSNVAQDAYVGIMGPILGTAVGFLYWALFFVTREPVFLALASWTFSINFFNLLPMPPLDGGWITPVFSPKLLALGMVLIVVVGIYNPLIIILAIMSLPRVIEGWKAKPETSPYFQATPRDRILYGSLYIGLAIVLGLAQRISHGQLQLPLGHQIL